MEKLRIGFSSGDINGIGIEVLIKVLSDKRILDYCTPIIYASTKVLSYHKNIVKPGQFEFQGIRDTTRPYSGKINVVTIWNEDISITLGEGTEMSGKFAYTSLDRSVNDLKKGLLDGVVTLPFNKQVMQSVGFPDPGHTEYFARNFEAEESLMLMVHDNLRVGVATNHIPVSQVRSTLSKQLILRKVRILHDSLRVDFGIDKPRIAVLGLNPHAGDQGAIGNDEAELITPVVSELGRKGILISGPHSADGFFGSGDYQKADGILAMYHDQGLIPFKTLSFGAGVNFTAGLSVVRTSPDHGTAFGLAGNNMAEPKSLRNALFLALDIVRNRRQHQEDHSQALQRGALEEDTGKNEPIGEQLTENP